ncbi:Rho-binding antiterminator [Shewanella sp. SG41-4]|uniref:Rho-binding antiterminator n=1 Tax=Shewanella sp. SG41-4 TaxID=2760976 RepID=UPI0016019949|nr:Rho-binding antiterminator [Shewanella sp. SG41-4]MBB1440605.1 Rho-binding antiterminator [Shewanella sp. SG41-4]
MEPIKCEIYDYIEIICLYRYRVKLTLIDGTHLQGQFDRTLYVSRNQQKHEAIAGMNQQQQAIEVILTDIISIDVLTKNASFNHLSLIQ